MISADISSDTDIYGPDLHSTRQIRLAGQDKNDTEAARHTALTGRMYDLTKFFSTVRA